MSRIPVTYEEARAEYRRLLDAYGRAVAARDPDVVTFFDQCTEAWQRLRRIAPPDSTEAQIDDEMHLVGAFSHAVGSGHAQEGQRIYDLMSLKQRQEVDSVESSRPGWLKIWLRQRP